MKKRVGFRTIVNKKAAYDYETLATYEAGIVLSGAEVKSIRLGRAQLKESYGFISQAGEAFLVNMHISPYPFADNEDYEPAAQRKLLLRRREIDELMGKLQQKGLSLIPLSIFQSRGKFKVKLGLVRGKKQFEKREKIKKKDLAREMRREFKDSYRG